MKQLELAKWLQRIIILSAFVGLFLCFILAPWLGRDTVAMYPELSYMYLPCLIFIWITALPFYIALWKLWLISCEISKDNSFCKENAHSLKLISKLALLECLLYLAAIIFLLILNLLHPSILLMALFIMFVGISMAVASATLSHLVEKASDLKQENDLTI